MIERLARLGYLSIGVVYIVAGALAAMRGSTRGPKGAFDFIQQQPFGRAILAVIVVGLAGYALWRFVDGIADSEGRGSDAKAIAVRIGSVARGILYAAIAIEVVRGRSGGDSTKHWTAQLLGKPFGRWLVAAIGLAFVGAAAYQLYRAFSAKLSKRLHMESLDASLRRKVVAVSRFGIAARGVIFFLIGGSLVVAALRYDPAAAEGTSGALHDLAKPLGGIPLVVVGIGLAAYGIYAFVNARYRSIRA
ncbi:MAG TPA: DUF1206 domain-containing protein [Thermoanaerobaculia bacterium]|nr:DUF1206 domain-containing protein [Thermoanaerobaculia bacterium]